MYQGQIGNVRVCVVWGKNYNFDRYCSFLNVTCDIQHVTWDLIVKYFVTPKSVRTELWILFVP